MKYLITGAGGQLGFDVKRELWGRGVEEADIAAPRSSELDIANAQAVENYVENFRPDVIFHCAAYTNVDGAESDQEACQKVNVDGTKNLVEAAQKCGAKIVYISTDYVFEGENPEPYEVDDKTDPQSVYGRTKRDGELTVQSYPKHFIVRIAWVFGVNGKNFVKTMLKVGKDRAEVSVVDDQIGSPTYTVDLAKFLVDLAESDKYGTYHATNEGFCSWAEFTEEIYRDAGLSTKVKKVSTEEYIELAGKPQAKRPKFSKLSKDSIEQNGFERLPSWQNATKRYIVELRKEGEL